MGSEPRDDDVDVERNHRKESFAPDPWAHDDSVVTVMPPPRGLVGRARALVRRAYDYLIRLRGSPEAIAWGLSIGLLIAMTPTVGLQMAIAVPVATLLRGNPAAAAAGCWLTNPLTIPFLYGLNYWLGAVILGYEPRFTIEGELTLDMLLSSSSHVWWSLSVGGLITGLGSALVAYYPTILMIRAGRAGLERRRTRRRARRARREAARRQSDRRLDTGVGQLETRDLD